MIPATGKGGRLTKGDVQDFITKGGAAAPAAAPRGAPTAAPAGPLPPRPEDPREERGKMTKLRKIITARLKEAQNTAAMLTTWNEVDMGAVMDLRATYKDAFEKKHDTRLGFMSPKGLVVPVLRDADKMSFTDIEGTIRGFGLRARDGKLGIDEMSGGTFTISNGGVFGSLNSMPILNVPQSAVLGMHKIDKRPVAIGDEVVIRPMMYLALSYDHRIVDGREAVSFLVRMKECIEDPQRILVDV